MKKFIKKMLRKLVNRFKPVPPTDALPKNTKYYSPFVEWDDIGYKTGVLIVQKEPQFRTVIGGDGRYFVPFPYSIFIIRFSCRPARDGNGLSYYFRSLQVGFISNELKTPEDEIAPLPLSNYEEGDGLSYLRICMGNTFGNPGYSNLQALVDGVIGGFWQSSFTALNPRIMQHWSKLTIKDVWQSIHGVPGEQPWSRHGASSAARRAKICDLVKIPQSLEKFQ